MKSLLLIAIIAISVAIPTAYAEISVTQDNLTAEEQKVLDDIAAARADGTYIAPPEAKLTATIQLYSEDVTISAPFPVGESYCGERIFKFGIPEMTCVIVGTAPVGEVWDVETSSWIPESVIKQEAAMAEKIKAAKALSPEEKQLQAIQNKIEQLKGKYSLSTSEQEALDSFSNISLCMRGLEDTEAFQTRNQFVIPVESLQLVDGAWTIVFPETSNNQSLSYRDGSLLSKMYKASQECEAQIKLMGYSTPDHYRNMIMNEADFQPTHQDMAKLDKAVDAFGTDFTDRQDGDSFTEAAKSNYVICISDKYSEKFKTQMGCPSPYIGFNEPTQEPTGFTLETASPMIKHERYGIVCGLLPDNGHIVNDIHWDYMKDLEQRFNCAHWDRVQGIMLFDPLNWNQTMIDEQIKKYQESQQ